MRDELNAELQRLFAVAAKHGAEIKRQPGASDAEIAEVERATGIKFNDDLRALYRLSNGGAYEDTWFAVFTDQLEPFRFCPLSEVREVHGWSKGSSYDEDWDNGGVPWDPRHRKYDRHAGWLPFADFGNSNATVYFDADPTSEGTYGQLLTYQHDPDAIRYCAHDLVEFLRKSNDLLEQHGVELLTA
jgi:cell wall assembly regulator SMI1